MPDEGVGIVAEVVRGVNAQAARVAGGDGVGKVDVAAAAAEDFVADDEELDAFRLHDVVPEGLRGQAARRVSARCR